MVDADHNRCFGVPTVPCINAAASTLVANSANDHNFGIEIGLDGTVVTNTADSNQFGFDADCPSNLVGNMSEDNSSGPFTSSGSGCNVQINLGF